MDVLLQTAALVSELPGNLVYHLVLLFTLVVGTGIAAIGWWQSRAPSRFPTDRHSVLTRLAYATATLAAIRLLLFIVDVLGAAGLVDPLRIIPPLDRAASTLSLLLIVWVFAFPEPARLADALLLALIVLILLAFGITLQLWAQDVAAGAGFYNGSAQETGWEVAQLALLGIGLILLAARRRSNWPIGLSLLLLLAIGHVVHTFFLTLGNMSVPGPVRLAEIVALPMLLAMIYRRAQAPAPLAPTPPGAVPAVSQPAPQVPAPGIDAKAAVALASLSATFDQEELCQVIALALAHTFRIQACILIEPPTEAGLLRVACGYDLAQEKFMPGGELQPAQIPEIAAALKDGKSAWLMPERHAAELRSLNAAVGLSVSGPARVVPLVPEVGQVLGAVALLPAQPEWSAEDQGLLSALTDSMAQTLRAAADLRQQRAVQQKQPEGPSAAGPADPLTIQRLTAELEAARTEMEVLARDLERYEADLEQQRLEAERLTNQLRAQQQADAGQPGLLGELNELRAKFQAAQREAEDRQRLEAELDAALERIDALGRFEAQMEGLAHQVEMYQQREQQARMEIERARRDARAEAQREVLAAAREEHQLLEMQIRKELDLTRAELQKLTLQAAQPAPAEGQAPSLADKLEHAEAALADAQAELAAATEKLNAVQDQLALKEREAAEGEIKGRTDLEVISSLTQELRQPMSSIGGYADLLLNESAGIIGALQRKFLERIKASTERMGALLNDLIQITAIEAGPLHISRESVDVLKVIEEAAQSCQAQLHEKELRLRKEVAANLPLVRADPDALRQILIHLLNNASGASAVNTEVLLNVQHEVERPVIGDPVHYLFIAVSDTGGGIAPDDQTRVFSRLYRADAPLIAGLGDTGVGLSMVKALVEAHGGRAWVISEQGVGSTFYVLMPLDSVAAKTSNNGAEP